MGKRQKHSEKNKLNKSKASKQWGEKAVSTTNEFEDDEEHVTDEFSEEENNGEDIGSKRVNSDDEEIEQFSDEETNAVEEVADLMEDPFHQWYNKRTFEDKEKEEADTILATYQLQTLDIGDNFQIKVSTNGLDDTMDYSKPQPTIPIKSRIEPHCQAILKQIQQHPRLQLFFQSLTHYHDILYASGEEISKTSTHNSLVISSLCIHLLNHVMKSTDIETTHTQSIKEKKRKLNEQTHERIMKQEALKKKTPYIPSSTVNLEEKIVIPTFQDQGFTRPKVLLLCPYRYYAYQFIDTLLSLLPHKMVLFGKNKFIDEFGDNSTDQDEETQAKWKEFFPGNNDDCFRMGISIHGKIFKLYSDFYNSDIVIASPLSLKQIEDKQGWDYLSSIEICIVYGMDMICMQNYDHLFGVIQNCNKTISKDRNTDFSRLREYFLNDHQKYMRQTILVGTLLNSNLLGLFHRSCFNPIGRLELRPVYEGAVSDILTPPRQLFVRLPCKDILEASKLRTQYIESNIVKILNNSAYKKILIYCDNYFEYIYTKRVLMENCDENDCGIIDEYLDDANNKRNRSYFINDTIRVLLFSGRYKYFKRMNIRGAYTIYFVSPPTYPDFYSDLVNAMNTGNKDGKELSVGVTVLYTKFDTYSLERIVGTSRYKKMLTGKRDMFLFC